MRKNRTLVVLLSAAIVVTAIYTGNALATAPSGFVSSTIAVGRLGAIDVLSHFIAPNALDKKDTWVSVQKSKGFSDLYVQSNVWAPGGTSGWHSHPGHSLIIVTAGTVTAYEGDDSTCKPTVYTQGMAFVDPGGDHFHNLRNEGTVEARTITVQLLPADAMRRIDAPYFGTCRF
jgi:quercetin dioxygenase-like cupin family protein